jgi:hypothetical protein
MESQLAHSPNWLLDMVGFLTVTLCIDGAEISNETNVQNSSHSPGNEDGSSSPALSSVVLNVFSFGSVICARGLPGTPVEMVFLNCGF